MSFSRQSNYETDAVGVVGVYIIYILLYELCHFPFWFSHAYCTNVTGFTGNLEVTL